VVKDRRVPARRFLVVGAESNIAVNYPEVVLFISGVSATSVAALLGRLSVSSSGDDRNVTVGRFMAT
jgi:hypothetical protein